jgi:hypothetical protein
MIDVGNSLSNFTVACIEIRNHRYSQGVFGTAPYFVTLSNLWIHKWWKGEDTALLPNGRGNDGIHGGIYNNYAGAGANRQGVFGFLITHCIINNVDGSQTYGVGVRGAGELAFCELAYSSSIHLHGGYSIHDNDFHHCPVSPIGDAEAHPNVTYLDNVNGGSVPTELKHTKMLFYNNYIHDLRPEPTLAIQTIHPNTGDAGMGNNAEYWIVNNVTIGDNSETTIKINDFTACPNRPGPTGTKVYAWGNTLHSAWDQTTFARVTHYTDCGNPSAGIGLFDARNNHIINQQNGYASLTATASSFFSRNLTNTPSQAHSDGYTTNNLLQPTSPTSATVGTGTNLSVHLNAAGLPAAALAAFLKDSSVGNHRTPVARPGVGGAPWDRGAYQFASVAPNIVGALTVTGYVGTPFSYQIQVDFGVTAYGASNLPSGLTFSGVTGLISGTPVSIATTSVTLLATNASGNDIDHLTLWVLAGQAVIAVSTNGIVFPEQIEDATADATIVVTNNGAAGTTLTGVANISSGGPWLIVGNSNYALASGTTTNITVRYAPTDWGQHSGTATFTGGGGHTVTLGGSAYYRATVNVPFRAIDTLIQSPFQNTNGTLFQLIQTTNAAEGGRAIYGFELSAPAVVTVSLLVNAADQGRDSMFFDIFNGVEASATTYSPTNINDIIPVTTGFEQRVGNWRGTTGTFDSPNFQPKQFSLLAGTYKLIFRGREVEAFITNATIFAAMEATSQSGAPLAFPVFKLR